MSGVLRIAVLSDPESWLRGYLPAFVAALEAEGHKVVRESAPEFLTEGDICFYLSVGRIVPQNVRAKFTHNLVVHESDLPRGKGWSPMTWQILDGASHITLTLFEAENKVDSGRIYAQRTVELRGTELVDEWRELQADATFLLCMDFVRDYPQSLAAGRLQQGEESLYPRRTPEDSQLDPHKTIAEQFDLLRVVDNDRYPAFFDYRGQRYMLKVSKAASNG